MIGDGIPQVYVKDMRRRMFDKEGTDPIRVRFVKLNDLGVQGFRADGVRVQSLRVLGLGCHWHDTRASTSRNPTELTERISKFHKMRCSDGCRADYGQFSKLGSFWGLFCKGAVLFWGLK